MSVTFLGPLSAGGIKLPMISMSSVGSQSPVIEKHVSIAELCEVREPDFFIASIQDDSMQGEHISKEDMLIVDRGRYAEHGDIVIASLNETQVCRRLHMRGNVVMLESSHKDYPSQAVTDNDDLIILGVVTQSLRRV
ncbi:S24 family peptidase [Pseudomonas alliivorans]|nr:S24 family peptidase [Pseudomonas alliivorans]MEE4703813.1 S24 family peptidase [Pseudomonas alliivorans]MEE4739787.1 S24 family peptidase [Pseudomonas alliivorans]MEE4804647.1 S24 family peptidase [Pseudomonas alliivorans]